MIGSCSFAFSSWHGELLRMKKIYDGRIEFSDG
jgi:hypothetical protein